jgi:hypothetical protein
VAGEVTVTLDGVVVATVTSVFGTPLGGVVGGVATGGVVALFVPTPTAERDVEGGVATLTADVGATAVVLEVRSRWEETREEPELTVVDPPPLAETT